MDPIHDLDARVASRLRDSPLADAGDEGDRGDVGNAGDQPRAARFGRMGETGEAMTITVVPTQSPTAVPPLGPRGFLRWAWRQLTSMRTALLLLFLLALASIPGSILPQRGINPILVREWIEGAPTWGPILDRFSFFDVYAAPWFAAIYLLLFISVIGCVLPRTAEHWRSLRSAPPRAPRRLDRLAEYSEWQTSSTATEVLDVASADLRRRRWRVGRGADEYGDWVSAEKGYSRETGNLLFHAALIALLIGVSYGALFGWRGNVIVREESGFAHTLTQYDAWGGGRLAGPDDLPPFSFTLDEFRVEFERSEAQRGSPRLFEAEITLRPAPGEPEVIEVIRVNEPISIDGSKVFLVGHGYAPTIRVLDGDGRVVFEDPVIVLPQDGNQTSTGVIKAPDSLPQLGFQALFLPTAAVDEVRGPHSSFPDGDDPAIFLSAWVGDLGMDTGVPQSIFRLDTDAMSQVGLEALRPGEVWELPDGIGSIEFVDWRRWASFQIAHDPGKEPALIASGVALFGLMLTLFVKRRRVWVRTTSGPDGVTVVHVAGLARSEEADIGADVEALKKSSGGAT